MRTKCRIDWTFISALPAGLRQGQNNGIASTIIGCRRVAARMKASTVFPSLLAQVFNVAHGAPKCTPVGVDDLWQFGEFEQHMLPAVKGDGSLKTLRLSRVCVKFCLYKNR